MAITSFTCSNNLISSHSHVEIVHLARHRNSVSSVLGTTRINTNGNEDFTRVIIPEIQKQISFLLSCPWYLQPRPCPQGKNEYLQWMVPISLWKDNPFFFQPCFIRVGKKIFPQKGITSTKSMSYKAGFGFVVYHWMWAHWFTGSSPFCRRKVLESQQGIIGDCSFKKYVFVGLN